MTPPRPTAAQLAPRRLTGRCANGAERDGGAIYHAVPVDSTFAPAACGAKPGRTSGGWSDEIGARVTCPRKKCRAALSAAGGDK